MDINWEVVVEFIAGLIGVGSLALLTAAFLGFCSKGENDDQAQIEYLSKYTTKELKRRWWHVFRPH